MERINLTLKYKTFYNSFYYVSPKAIIKFQYNNKTYIITSDLFYEYAKHFMDNSIVHYYTQYKIDYMREYGNELIDYINKGNMDKLIILIVKDYVTELFKTQKIKKNNNTLEKKMKSLFNSHKWNTIEAIIDIKDDTNEI